MVQKEGTENNKPKAFMSALFDPSTLFLEIAASFNILIRHYALWPPRKALLL